MPGDKYFLWNSIPNLIWIFGLVYYLYLRKSVGAVMVAMFVYLSLHGGYAIFAAATGDGINTLNTLHYQSSDLGVKLAGVGFLAYCSVLLALRVQKPLKAVRESIFFKQGIFFLLLIFLACMVFGAIDHPGISSAKLQTVLKETSFAVCMWVGIFVFSIVVKQGRDYFISNRREWFFALIILAVLMLAGGFYEIGTGVVWAGTYYVSGFSYRTSGTLFNPNVLGFWCAIVAALVSLVFHLGWISRRASFGAMMVVVCLLILSSSRSGLVLSMVNLFAVSAILFLNRKAIPQSRSDRAWPLIAFMLSFAVFVLVIESASPSPYSTINTLFANLNRFLQLPVDIFWIFMMKVFFPAMQKLDPLLTPMIGPAAFVNMEANMRAAADVYETGKIMESVNGRILLEYISDNSFMSIYAVGGVVSLVIWLWLWAVLFWKGIRKNMNSPGIFSAHALGGLILCFVSGFFLRTPQLFPVWIFLSMVLGACLCWWSADENSIAVGGDSVKLRHPAKAV